MNKLNNNFTTNQFFALQNFTWGGVRKPLLNKELCKNVNKNIT